MPDNHYNKPLTGRAKQRETDQAIAERHSPNGGLREIRRRNGVDVDGPPQISEAFAKVTERARRS